MTSCISIGLLVFIVLILPILLYGVIVALSYPIGILIGNSQQDWLGKAKQAKRALWQVKTSRGNSRRQRHLEDPARFYEQQAEALLWAVEYSAVGKFIEYWSNPLASVAQAWGDRKLLKQSARSFVIAANLYRSSAGESPDQLPS